MKRLLPLIIFATVISSITAFAQPTISTAMATRTNVIPYMQVSDDGTLISFNSLTDNKCSNEILNLKDFSRRSVIPFVCGVTFSPDMRSAYNKDGFSPSADTLKPNFTLTYSKDATKEFKKIIEGSFHPFGFTREGNLIGGDASLSSIHFNTLKNLRVVNPMTGVTIKKLYQGVLVSSKEGALAYKYPMWFLNTTKTMLIKADFSGGTKLMIFPFNGKPAYSFPIEATDLTFMDTTVVGFKVNLTDRTARLRAFSLKTGAMLLDSLVKSARPWKFSYINYNRIYAFPDDSGVFNEYKIENRQLQLVRTAKLEMDDVNLPKERFFTMIVSPSISRISIIPSYQQGQTLGNEAYFWDMNTGKLVHKINNFYSDATYVNPAFVSVPPVDPCVKTIASLRLKPGDYIMQPNVASIYKITKFDCFTKNYTLEYQVAYNNNLPQKASLSVGEFMMGKYTRVNAETCGLCKGYGTQNKKQNYETVEKGIYVKYTTTGSFDKTVVCGQCKGAGVLRN